MLDKWHSTSNSPANMADGEMHETLPISALEADRRSRSSVLPFSRSAADGGTGGVPCAAIGEVPIALDTLQWQMGQALRLTVVMKANFCLNPLEGTSRPAAWPPRFNPADVYWSNQPTAHVLSESDRVPWKRNVDITLRGHARTAFGRPMPHLGLSFIGRDGQVVLFEKRARVIGNRAAAEDSPEPFVTMPLVYERAYGGPATLANPIGTGDAPGAPLPNVVDASNPWRPAAFGPIAADWPLRRRKLGALQPADLDRPVLDLPLDFDVSYFQSAPADQQVLDLGPAAMFVLGGFHHERPKVEITLPDALPGGAVFGLWPDYPDAPFPLHFRMDTVNINAQMWVLSLTYRACVELPDAASVARLRVAAGLGKEGRPCRVPPTWAHVDDAPAVGREDTPDAPRPEGLSETLDLVTSLAGVASSTPFGKLRSPFVESSRPTARLAELELDPEPAAPAEPPAFAPPPSEPPARPSASDLSTTLATPVSPASAPVTPAVHTAPPASAPVTPASAPVTPAVYNAPPATPPATPLRPPCERARRPRQGPLWAGHRLGPRSRSGRAAGPQKAAPKPRPERKFSLKKGFSKR
ncbi:MAG: DUF2169 domain-containing protein [Polyangiaceae bacterium]